MHRICGLNVELTKQELKYYKVVFMVCTIVPLFNIFLLGSMAVSGMIRINYLMSVIVILFTIYFLYILRIDKVGTKQHLYGGVMLVGSYLFYDTSRYNIILGLILCFVVFISFINGRELQARKK